MTLIPGTMAQRSYAQERATEQFRCNYGLNPAYEYMLGPSGLQVSGLGPAGEARIVELPTNHFYMATLFLPQLSSTPTRPHPLIVTYVRVAWDARG